MKTIILCILTLFIGLVSRAQSNTASLNVILTDIQSVTFSSATLIEASRANQPAQTGTLQVLSRSTSQIKKINSNTAEYTRLYKEFYSGSAGKFASSSNAIAYRADADRSNPRKSGSKTNSSLVIYQIDPR